MRKRKIDKYILILCFLPFLACSKKDSSPPTQKASVSFNFIDNKSPSGMSISWEAGKFDFVSGGNTSSNDTTHGYIFSATGPNGSNVSLSFEIPALQSGTYSYKAFSTAWPRPLGLDSWTGVTGIGLQPDTCRITVNFKRLSNSSADGEFSLSFTNGSQFVEISNGVFAAAPIRQ